MPDRSTNPKKSHRSAQPQQPIQFVITPEEYRAFADEAAELGVSKVTLFRRYVAASMKGRRGRLFQPRVLGARADLKEEK
jgi:hypothetical protein